MTQSSQRPESPLPVRREWSNWPVYAALIWSAGYAALAVVWSLGGPGFPYGDGDPEGADMGSVLFAARAGATAPVIAVCCVAGVVVALAMLRSIRRQSLGRFLLIAAWLFAAVLILVIADVRVLQNTAYALMFVFVKLDWTVLNQGILVLGGGLWSAAAVAYYRRYRGTCRRCGRTDATADRPEWIVRWGKVAAYTAFLAPLPYAVTRAAWALDIPLGLDALPPDTPLGARLGELGLAALALGGGIVSLGLIRTWGETWPRWIPVLGTRRVPVLVPLVPGLLVATLILIGALSLARGELGLTPPPAEAPTVTGWGTWAPGLLWPFWSLGLGVASVAYYYRVRGRCRVCTLGQEKVTAGQD